MDHQISNKFCDDIVKISNIIPNLSAATICSELKKVQDQEDRLLIVLRKYLLEYDVKYQNALRDDIMKIKGVLPEYSIVNITKDLNEVAHEPYRVQIVLKKYLVNENVPVKRRLDNDNELIDLCGKSAEKKRKSCEFSETDKQTTLYDAVNKLYPGTRKDVLLQICTKWNINMNKTPSDAIVNFIVNKLFGDQQNITNENTEEPIEVDVAPVAGPSNIENENINDSQQTSNSLTQDYALDELQELFENHENDDTESEKVNQIQNSVAQPDTQSVLLANKVKEPIVIPEVKVLDRNIDMNDSENTEEDPYINTTTYDVFTANVTRLPIVPPSDAFVVGLNRQISNIIEDVNIRTDFNVHRLSRTKIKKENTVSDEDRAGHIKNIENDLITSYNKSLLLSGANTGASTSARTNPKINNATNTVIPDAVPSTSTGIPAGGIPVVSASRIPVVRKASITKPNLGVMDDDDVIITSVQNQIERTPVDLKVPKPVTLASTSEGSKEKAVTRKPGTEHPFFFKLMEMFPDICPTYLRNLCADKPNNNSFFDGLMNQLLDGIYERRIQKPKSPELQLDFEEQYRLLIDLFPDADPSYLQHHCERLIDQPDEFRQFITSMMDTKSYPSKEQYIKKMKLSAQERQYTTEFDVTKFLELIPNPEQYFNDPNRTVSYKNPSDFTYALNFLKNHYCHLHVREIHQVFNAQRSVLKAAQLLDCFKRQMRAKRKLYSLTSCQNIPLLQEIAYVKHREEISNYIKHQEEVKLEARKHAKEAGLMKTCGCCFDDEIMVEDTACCEAGHIFCKDCVKKGCEVVIGQGKLHFACLEMCDSYFSLQILQAVLTPKVFSKMAQRKQLEEVKAAGIEDLEFCPFCDFATIPAPGDKIFRCLNDECMKESCRECREPSHIPLRCNEVEKEADVKLRTYIEDKMTEALVRKCYKCGLKFVKADGCNKMTCSCGAMMCYVCNQPVQDYKHFNGQGGDQVHLCPLYSDTVKLHMEAVKLGAETAKKELGIGTDDKQLKFDPTENLVKHYKEISKRTKPNPPIPMV